MKDYIKHQVQYRGYFIEYDPEIYAIGGVYAFHADGYDGSPDAEDYRCGRADSIEDALYQIDEMEA